MHSDREKLVEQLQDAIDYLSMAAGHDDEIAAIAAAIAALSEPVKDEPVAWQRRRLYPNAPGDTPQWAACPAREATGHFEREAGYEYRPLYTRPAGERPAVAVEALEAQAWNCGEWPVWLHAIVSKTNEVADRLDMSSEQAHAFAALSALTAEPQAVPEGMVPVPTGIELRADEWLGELIYRALYEHEGGKWAAVEPRYVWYNAGARFRAMLAASPAVQGGE